MDMIEQKVKVVKLFSDMAICESLSRTGCAKCEAGEGCGGGVFSKLFGSKTYQIEVLNKLQLQPGEKVTIGISESAITFGSLLLYFVPLLGLILGALIAELGQQKPDELWTILMSIVGFFLGILLVKSNMKTKFFLKMFKPVMIQRSSIDSNQTL